jgi:inner membrane protein
MDSLTHIVLGAAIGEIVAGRRLGKKAMWLGALAQSLPDIDFVASFWMDTAHDLVAHRGFTHSILFVVLATPLLAWLGYRWSARKRMRQDETYGPAMRQVSVSGMRPGSWLFFFGLEISVHILLDAFNAYGTGWFEPFSHYRVSFHALFVVDPFYSIWLGICFVALLIIPARRPSRKVWATAGLILSTAYLYYCVLDKWKVDNLVRDNLDRQHVAYSRYLATPTPMNNWLWWIVAEDSAGFHTGYMSVFDRHTITFHYVPRQDSLLADVRNREDLRYLLRFSQGYYSMESHGDTLIFNDLRFGQVRGWEDTAAAFVFHYYVRQPGSNVVILQRGRLEGWNRKSLRAFTRRIRGN